MSETKRSIFYDMQGLPISARQAQILMHDHATRVVAETQFETTYGTLWVVTMHMVIDQYPFVAMDDEHVPVLYATRLHGILDQRNISLGIRGASATRDEAIETHLEVVKDVIEELGSSLLSVYQHALRREAA